MHFPPPARARRRTVVCLTGLRKAKLNELESSASLKFQFESRVFFSSSVSWLQSVDVFFMFSQEKSDTFND